jgi:hypothetical protein
MFYGQVMLDIDGDGRITKDEFLAVVKEGMAVERRQLAAASLGAGMMGKACSGTTAAGSDCTGLDKVAAFVARDPAAVGRLFATVKDDDAREYMR